MKESTESKGYCTHYHYSNLTLCVYSGSRSRRSSVTAPTGSGTDDSGNTKKMKVATGGGASGTAEKKTHKSPEKRTSSTSSHTAAAVATVAETINVSGTVIKEEKMDVVQSSTSSDTPTIPPSATITTTTTTITTHSSPIATQTTPRSASKKRNLENLTLNVSASGSTDIIFLHDESPLPCPMTVPKEEQLRESIAASGGRLSRTLLHPLSPDMHIIVQQPNIAAITAGNERDSLSSTSTTGNTNPIDVKVATDKPPEKLQDSTALSKSNSLAITTGTPQSKSKIEGNEKTDSVPLAIKQELLQIAAPTGPKTVAEALSSTLRLKLSPPVSKHFSLPTTLPVNPVTETQVSRASSKMTSSATDKTTIIPPSITATSTTTVSSSINLPTYPVPSSYTPLTNPPPPPSPSTATTVVSSILSDPRLSSGAFRPAKNSSQQQQQQTTLPQVHTTGDKNKPQVTKIKTKLEVGEEEKKKMSEERSQTLKQKEQVGLLSLLMSRSIGSGYIQM